MKKKRLMILGASILQLPAIETAVGMGLDVIVVDMNPEAVGFGVSGVKKEVISTIDIPAILESARRNKIDGIMTLATDMPMRSVAAVCKEMGLIGISEETALKATNKACMRDALKAYGVPIPMYYKVKGVEQLYEAINQLHCAGYECIVKPTDNSGSRGVIKVSENADIDSVYDYSIESSRGGELIVEECMEGPEVSVETIAIDGNVYVIQITDKLTTGAPYYVELGHSQPSRLNESIKGKIRSVAIDANKALGIMNGPSHTEIIVTKDGPKVVEIGARLGGDNINTHLVPLSTGINIVECCIKIALGDTPDVSPQFRKGSAIRYFDQHAGVICDISGIEDAQAVAGVKQVSIVHGVGEKISEIINSGSRMGFVIAQADSADEAIDACDKAIALIRISINKENS